ncbi:C40 family peptidase [Bacillus sp. BRMEA1]|uniref:C40 family peptidase n=1 Tax=Neobacillus endophyticus TaxID=2738405 RepID=UPI0015632486|nr:C40 family peptidase [Neobacillus endophyticus]NRD76520.1 C40 family peptidase [Neobacillus endophyticus]
MLKKFVKYSVSVAVIAAMMQTTPTFASTVTQDQINATQGQINDFETKIQKLDNQIIIGMDKSQKLSTAISAEKVKIEKTKSDIEQAQKDLDAHKEVYSARLKSMQEDGQQPVITYAELLFSSDNLSQFLTRFTAISQIIQSDTDLLNGLNEKEQALKTAGEKLHSELNNLKQSQNELAAEQKKIEADKQEIEKELASAKNNLQSQKTQLAQQQAEEKAKQEALAAQKRLAEQRALAQQQAQQRAQSQASSSASFTAVSGSNSGDASSVIAYAEQFLGTPYVWGGTTPSGFDCSGFMQYVFRSVGVDLPRVAADQQNVGTRISPDQVQPGDLVFKGDPAYHVGMYIGGGKWIQSPETGDVVKISNYNPAKFSSAARVLR